MRYAVLIKPPDDHPAAIRLVGYFERARAEQVEREIRARIDAAVEEDPELAETCGYAYIARIEGMAMSEAVEWALRGEANLR